MLLSLFHVHIGFVPILPDYAGDSSFAKGARYQVAVIIFIFLLYMVLSADFFRWVQSPRVDALQDHGIDVGVSNTFPCGVTHRMAGTCSRLQDLFCCKYVLCTKRNTVPEFCSVIPSNPPVMFSQPILLQW